MNSKLVGFTSVRPLPHCGVRLHSQTLISMAPHATHTPEDSIRIFTLNVLSYFGHQTASSSESWLPHLKTEAVKLELTSMVTEWKLSASPLPCHEVEAWGTQAQAASWHKLLFLSRESSQEAVLSKSSRASSHDPVQGLPGHRLGPWYTFKGRENILIFISFKFRQKNE